ncbi:hypothetical protein AAG570_006843 [Ranatra chinensis]|uniref:Sphingomyelin synthase-like domain-containing protein n=1 Tax=Ranatra chinensis TaxID=642074 RepID=A0ABD0YVW2_9HEMI
MSQHDLCQRQPLLNQEWPGSGGGGGGGGGSAAAPYLEDDEDDKSDSLKRSVANGDVIIEVPTGLRIERPKFPKEKWKTFVAFMILVVNFILTTASLAMVHEKVPDRTKYPPLPDVFLDNIPTVPWALDISEIIIMISTNVCLLVIIFHKHRFIVFRRVFLLLAVLYLMRSITMFVTVLPMSSTTYYCSPKANSTSALLVSKRVFQLISGFGLSINGKQTYCGDFIYSGHTVILVMCYLIINEYSPKRLIVLHWGSWLASILGIILVLVARGHYTVDILIAYYVTTRTFYIYHTLANNHNLKKRSANNSLSRLWWFRIFLYFEERVSGPVPRIFNWPPRLPRWIGTKHPSRDS